MRQRNEEINMTIRQITVHGKSFELDTQDWDDSDSADIADAHMTDSLLSLSAEQIAKVHADLLAERENGVIEKIQRAAIGKAVKGWVRQPTSGCNAFISAL